MTATDPAGEAALGLARALDAVSGGVGDWLVVPGVLDAALFRIEGGRRRLVAC